MLEVGFSMTALCPLAKPENNRGLGGGGCASWVSAAPPGRWGSIHLKKVAVMSRRCVQGQIAEPDPAVGVRVRVRWRKGVTDPPPRTHQDPDAPPATKMQRHEAEPGRKRTRREKDTG